jgi:hypothetical protein
MRGCGEKGAAVLRFARKRGVRFWAVERIDETCSSSYCWQPGHLRALQKIPRIAPLLSSDKAKEKNVMFHENVKTANCHRLRQCTEWNCSKIIMHRDFSAAGFIAVGLLLRMYGGIKCLRFLVSHLVDGAFSTPYFLQRGKPRTEQKDMRALRPNPDRINAVPTHIVTEDNAVPARFVEPPPMIRQYLVHPVMGVPSSQSNHVENNVPQWYNPSTTFAKDSSLE